MIRSSQSTSKKIQVVSDDSRGARAAESIKNVKTKKKKKLKTLTDAPSARMQCFLKIKNK